jgi:nitrite reductase (NADH) large subunit
MRTSERDMFVLGECAEAHGGVVAPPYGMANIVAAQRAGDASAAFNPSATATKLKATGIAARARLPFWTREA